MHRPFGAGSRVVVRFTECADGDFDIDADGVAERRRAVDGRPCTWLDEQHGTDVVTVTEPGQHAGALADAAVTAVPERSWWRRWPTARPSPSGPTPGRSGWCTPGGGASRPGVLGNAVAALRGLGDAALNVEIGPSIRAGCYPFGPADLDRLADRFGAAVVAVTSDGAPALDLPAAVRQECARLGVARVHDWGLCTACSPRLWSWRARRDTGRHALFVVTEPGSPGDPGPSRARPATRDRAGPP